MKLKLENAYAYSIFFEQNVIVKMAYQSSADNDFLNYAMKKLAACRSGAHFQAGPYARAYDATWFITHQVLSLLWSTFSRARNIYPDK